MKVQYKVRTIVCENCGVTLTKRMPKGRRFCSLNCYRTAPRPDRKTGETFGCGICSKPVYIPKCRLGQEQYFCSKEHATEWQGRNKTTHICKMCDKSFRWSPSRTQSGQYNITYCSLACRDADPERSAMLIALNVRQQEGRRTIPERIGYGILDSLRVAYEAQYLIGEKFCVDAFVPSVGLVVQFDGDYWHGNPERFPTPDRRQQRRMKLDNSQDAYMSACGYSVIRIWETDLKKHPEAVTARLQRLLVPDIHTPAAHP